jgi:hypothetical protein
MIFLAVEIAIFHEVTCALLQLNVINFRFAAGGTALRSTGLFSVDSAHTIIQSKEEIFVFFFQT